MFVLVSCPNAWHKRNGHCYFVKETLAGVSLGLSWNDAYDYCIHHLNAKLISITNEDETRYISNLLDTSKSYWIGLAYNMTLKEFRWSDGSVYNYNLYTNWHSKEPISPQGRECIEVYGYANRLGKWNNRACTDKLGFICEITGKGDFLTVCFQFMNNISWIRLFSRDAFLFCIVMDFFDPLDL